METRIGPCFCEKPEKFIEEDGKQILIRCPHYVKLKGNDPQGGEIDEWRCSMDWIPILLIENTKKVLEMGAAIESFRNEMVRQNNEVIRQHIEHKPMPIDLIENGR